MIIINQDKRAKLIETKKSVNWLIDHTEVAVFDPISFKGYQRSIDDKHCGRIVSFLEKEFFLPTPIICSVDSDFNEDTFPLKVVDGQHRIHALKMLRSNNPGRYREIESLEIPVIVMAGVDENLEIETFININKTAKKVDTSLAFVLRNKINRSAKGSDDLTIPRAEYLAVELARLLNEYQEEPNIWHEKILYEGQTKNTLQLITLNAFVKSARSLLNLLGRKNIISLSWNDKVEMDRCQDECLNMALAIWTVVTQRWWELFDDTLEKRRIIQGPIGFSSINIVLKRLVKEYEIRDCRTLANALDALLSRSTIDYQRWLPGNYFSKYSSESGYNIIADEIIASNNNSNLSEIFF